MLLLCLTSATYFEMCHQQAATGTFEVMLKANESCLEDGCWKVTAHKFVDAEQVRRESEGMQGLKKLMPL